MLATRALIHYTVIWHLISLYSQGFWVWMTFWLWVYAWTRVDPHHRRTALTQPIWDNSHRVLGHTPSLGLSIVALAVHNFPGKPHANKTRLSVTVLDNQAAIFRPPVEVTVAMRMYGWICQTVDHSQMHPLASIVFRIGAELLAIQRPTSEIKISLKPKSPVLERINKKCSYAVYFQITRKKFYLIKIFSQTCVLSLY